MKPMHENDPTPRATARSHALWRTFHARVRVAMELVSGMREVWQTPPTLGLRTPTVAAAGMPVPRPADTDRDGYPDGPDQRPRHDVRGGVTHGDCARWRLVIEGSRSVISSRNTETHTLRTGPSDFSREPIVPGWI